MSHLAKVGRGRLAAWVLLLAGVAGCAPSDDVAVRVVEAYNRKLVEAYRTGDFRLLAEVAGPDEFRKVTALIGVKADQGLTLDARLLELEVQRVERRGDELAVVTRERWYYVDRQVGTGRQVGESSEDRYELRYHLGRPARDWVVVEVEFVQPPVVGRKEVPRGSGGVGHFGLAGGPERPSGAGPVR